MLESKTLQSQIIGEMIPAKTMNRNYRFSSLYRFTRLRHRGLINVESLEAQPLVWAPHMVAIIFTVASRDETRVSDVIKALSERSA